MSYADIKNFVYNTITYSFLDKQKKEALKKDLNERFKKFEQYILSNQPK